MNNFCFNACLNTSIVLAFAEDRRICKSPRIKPTIISIKFCGSLTVLRLSTSDLGNAPA